MGDFSEDSFDRELFNHIYDMENEDQDCVDDTDFDKYIRYPKIKNNDVRYPKIDDDTLQRIITNEDGFLIRKPNGKCNILATCVWQGDKSFLCHVENFGNRRDIGKSFFVPKSIVMYNKNEKKVIYLPNWAKPWYSK